LLTSSLSSNITVTSYVPPESHDTTSNVIINSVFTNFKVIFWYILNCDNSTDVSGLILPIHCVSLLANFVMCMELKAVLFRTHISVAGALLNTAKVLLHCTAAAVK
jgi:hypothetical protein